MYRLLLAEDEDLFREKLLSILPWSRFGITEVRAADDGESALELAAAWHPHIVLTDIRMPRRSGISLVHAVRELDPEVRVIFFSGYGDFEYAREAVRLAAFDYILKPVQRADLERALQRAVQDLDQAREAVRVRAGAGPLSDGAELQEDAESEFPRGTRAPVNGAGRRLAERTAQYLRAHLDQDLSLTDVASAVHVSPFHLCRLFKAEMGENFSVYLHRLRVERARELLRTTDLKVFEVAEQVGYRRTDHFVKLFKRMTGCTPAEYRTGRVRQ